MIPLKPLCHEILMADSGEEVWWIFLDEFRTYLIENPIKVEFAPL
jgi:hypothetical protein